MALSRKVLERPDSRKNSVKLTEAIFPCDILERASLRVSSLSWWPVQRRRALPGGLVLEAFFIVGSRLNTLMQRWSREVASWATWDDFSWETKETTSFCPYPPPPTPLVSVPHLIINTWDYTVSVFRKAYQTDGLKWFSSFDIVILKVTYKRQHRNEVWNITDVFALGAWGVETPFRC